MPLVFGNKRIRNIGRAAGGSIFLIKLLFYKELGVPMAFHHKHRFCCCTCVGVPMDLGKKQSSGHRICFVTWRRLVGYPRDTRGIPVGYPRDISGM